jgi:hypothetical protein
MKAKSIFASYAAAEKSFEGAALKTRTEARLIAAVSHPGLTRVKRAIPFQAFML